MFIFIVFAVTLFLDQWSKYLIEQNVDLYQSIPVIQDVFHITYTRNQGAAFGILQGRRTFFIVITIVVLALLAYFYRELPLKNLVTRFAMGLAIGGIIGNFIDRVRLGYVIDFLDFRIWPIFNVADSAIVVAVIIFSYWFLVVEEI